MTDRQLLHSDSPCKTLRVLSLFAGIGGIDLGLERAGMQVVAHSEIEPYACKVLAKHWPDVPNLGDIQTVKFGMAAAVRRTGAVLETWDIGPIDVIAGGFPCQDISFAGKGAGINEGTRSGLWTEYARAIRDIQPRYVIVENVAALLTRGLDRVLGDLAACGYDATWDCVPAAAVGAPHRRDRLFVVATRADLDPVYPHASPMQWAQEQRGEPHRDSEGTYSNAHSQPRSEERPNGGGGPSRDGAGQGGRHGSMGDGAPANTSGQSEREPADEAFAVATCRNAWNEPGSGGEPAAHAGSVEHEGDRDAEWRSRAEGVYGRPASYWSVEPGVGRVAPGISHRVDRLRCLGNAVVPQVAQYIGELVVDHHESTALEATA